MAGCPPPRCGTPRPLEKVLCSPAPNASRGGEGARRVSALLLAQGGGGQGRVRAGPPAGSRAPARGGGAWVGAPISHPSPSGRWRFREHPARSSAAGGGGSRTARSPAAERGGEERAWARGRHPHAALRASEAPHAQGRARAPKGGGRGWQGREQTPGLCPPLLHRSPPPPTSPTRSRPQTPH